MIRRPFMGPCGKCGWGKGLYMASGCPRLCDVAEAKAAMPPETPKAAMDAIQRAGKAKQ